jgi:hypothetical protein
MTSKWMTAALLFSVAVNAAVVGTLVYFWRGGKPPMHLAVMREFPPQKGDLLKLREPHFDPQALREMDFLKRQYGVQLESLQSDIMASRRDIMEQLQKDFINRDSLDILIAHLADEQIHAERLTIDHLIAIRPHLPPDEWRNILRDMESPPRMIKTITIENDSTLDGIINRQKIKEIHIFNSDKK